MMCRVGVKFVVPNPPTAIGRLVSELPSQADTVDVEVNSDGTLYLSFQGMTLVFRPYDANALFGALLAGAWKQ